ncbi:MAG TPA: endo-1,4-beta-xylanase [Saprospiraceae bacterium]|nr:endo-1,4-beta-xylanase [Saprospiraceae bacterium]
MKHNILLLITLFSLSLSAQKGLKDYADFPIGSAISTWGYNRDTVSRDIHVREFNSITANNQMKMASIAREKGVYNFDPADQMVAFAEKYNQRLFGHALVWHSSTPTWLSEIENNPVALDSFMRDYIHKYVGRYKGKVDGWDVVNEAMNTAGPGWRETIWYKALGKEYVAKALRYAHEADPDAVLFVNDFNTERDTAKLHETLRMIKWLQSEKVPISGLGFQMHLRMDIPNETIEYALRKGAETGLMIHLSEVDIIFNTHDDTQGGGKQLYDDITPEMLAAQGKKYEDIVRIYRKVVPKSQQYGITFWGYSDRSSWINGFFKLKDWPTIYDANMQPKPAYEGFKRGLGK